MFLQMKITYFTLSNTKRGTDPYIDVNTTWAGTKSFLLYFTGSNGLPLPNIARPYIYALSFY